MTMKFSDKNFLNRFPKTRRALPKNFSKIYSKEYLLNRSSGGFSNYIARILETWMHYKTAKVEHKKLDRILEIGAGSLNHLSWEVGYKSYDVVEPFARLLKLSPNIKRLRFIYKDINKIPRNNKYGRIISIATLEHVLDLPYLIAKSSVHLERGAFISAGVPTEGSLLWKLAWKYGTGLGFKIRTGLDYSILMKYEHVNNIEEIEYCFKYFFNDVSIKRFPFFFKHLSLYTFIVAHRPKKRKILYFLKNRNKL
jgi:hypothetical protein